MKTCLVVTYFSYSYLLILDDSFTLSFLSFDKYIFHIFADRSAHTLNIDGMWLMHGGAIMIRLMKVQIILENKVVIESKNLFK